MTARSKMDFRIITLALTLFPFLTSAAGDFGLKIGYTVAAGVLKSGAQTGSVTANLTRLLGGTAELFWTPSESKWTYAFGETLSSDFSQGTADFRCYGLGANVAWYEPSRRLANGALIVTNNQTFDPYWKLRFSVTEHTTSFVNPTNENLETLKIQNLGLLLGAGSQFKNGFGEAGFVLAPVSLSTPSFVQFWFLATVGWSATATR